MEIAIICCAVIVIMFLALLLSMTRSQLSWALDRLAEQQEAAESYKQSVKTLDQANDSLHGQIKSLEGMLEAKVSKSLPPVIRISKSKKKSKP